MGNFFVFCLLVGSFGAFIGVFFDFSIIGLALCIIANCLLFMGASVGGTIAFAESLKAAQFHYVSDGKHKLIFSTSVLLETTFAGRFRAWSVCANSHAVPWSDTNEHIKRRARPVARKTVIPIHLLQCGPCGLHHPVT